MNIPGFRRLPQTGVVYVMQRAIESGYAPDSSWANLGQGAPETGPLEGAPGRIENLYIPSHLHEYSPVGGQIALRQKVADLYNYRYRQNKESKYSWKNVSISGGGRVALTRIAASLGNINMGHFLPDYTAYEELLGIFKAFVPIPILLDAESGYEFSLSQIEKEITGRGLRAVLISNPCNPTGQVVQGAKLDSLVASAREKNCCWIFDEFYSHYIYTDINAKNPLTVSAAEYVNDVNRDPIVIVDGLTKNWRYPGWRVGWTIGPEEVIKTIISAGSFMDGGPSNLIQQQVIDLLEPEYAAQEARALQICFFKKREYAVNKLQKLGIIIEKIPDATFYLWVNLSNLPDRISDGFKFFEACLEEKVITIPGIFFDINPEKRRTSARFCNHARISFGPSIDELERGIGGIERVISG